MSWNYRVLKTPLPNGEVQWAIHEVYYDEDGTAHSWTESPVYPSGETTEEFAGDFQHYIEALKKPPLEVVDGVTLVELPRERARVEG